MIQSLFILSLAGTILVIFFGSAYWCWIRPLLLTKLRYKLFALRDEMRLGLREGTIKPVDEGYVLLEQTIRERLQTLPLLGMWSVIMGLYGDTGNKLEGRKRVLIFRQSEATIQSLGSRATEVSLGAVLVNSPGWWPLFAVILIAAYVSDAARKWWDDWTALSLSSGSEWAT